MKQFLQKTFLLCLFVLMGMTTFAYDFEVDGIYYEYGTEPQMVSVTSGDNLYSGTVNIPEKVVYNGITYSVTSIGKSAFIHCSGLTSVTIPNSVTSIGSAAFYGCSGLTSMTIPNSVTSIDNSAFYECSGLTTVDIPNSVTSIGSSAFSGCKSLTSVDIPNSITSISDGAFYECYSLTSVNIPNSVTSIDWYAFYCCYSLTSVNIPNSVTSIGNYAFWGCNSLTEVISLNLTPPTIGGSGTFDEATKQSATLYVPVGSKDAYAQAFVWNEFLNIHDSMPNAIEAITMDREGRNNAIYTLDGTKVNAADRSALPAGLYIIDGKKHAVK